MFLVFFTARYNYVIIFPLLSYSETFTFGGEENITECKHSYTFMCYYEVV